MELENYIKCYNGGIQTRTISSLLKFLNNKALFKPMDRDWETIFYSYLLKIF